MADSVELLGLAFLACVAMTFILGYLGIHVLKREIIFVDIALAQIVAVAAIGAHLMFGVRDDSLMSYMGGFAFAVLAAGFYAVVRRRVTQISLEAVIGVSYAVAAAGALFLIGIAPGGHVHVQQMLSGSILWATWHDIFLCTVTFSVVGFCFYLLRRPFGRISHDYDEAVRQGVNVIGWDFLFYILIGAVITVAVRIGGLVVVFCFLVIPATISALLVRGTAARLLLTWAAGVSAALFGLLFAHRLDFSVGPAVALFLGIELVLAALWARRWILIGSVATALTVLTYAGLLVAIKPDASARNVLEQPCPMVHVVDERLLDPPHGEDHSPLENAALATDCETLTTLEAAATDAHSRSMIVMRAFDSDPQCGTFLAVRFLERDPPFFFRQQVVDRLNNLSEEPSGYDAQLSSRDDHNLRALQAIKERHLTDQ